MGLHNLTMTVLVRRTVFGIIPLVNYCLVKGITDPIDHKLAIPVIWFDLAFIFSCIGARPCNTCNTVLLFIWIAAHVQVQHAVGSALCRILPCKPSCTWHSCAATGFTILLS